MSWVFFDCIHCNELRWYWSQCISCGYGCKDHTKDSRLYITWSDEE